ncbi:hypothetical protein [Culicoidibacter larvae]|uniref:hypothetical protein n=1 Tax=Culicoidibacter larvae TaxID=2579976 RepID=UPI001484DE6C|nr:hypothetical protein [Culicoidibacter larvae]
MKLKFTTFKQLASIDTLIGIAIRGVSFVQYILTLVSAIIALNNPEMITTTGAQAPVVTQIILLTSVMLVGAIIETIGFIYAYRWSRKLSQPVSSKGTTLLIVFGVLGVATWLLNIVISGINAALLPLIPMLPSLGLILIGVYTRHLASQK